MCVLKQDFWIDRKKIPFWTRNTRKDLANSFLFLPLLRASANLCLTLYFDAGKLYALHLFNAFFDANSLIYPLNLKLTMISQFLKDYTCHLLHIEKEIALKWIFFSRKQQWWWWIDFGYWLTNCESHLLLG